MICTNSIWRFVQARLEGSQIIRIILIREINRPYIQPQIRGVTHLVKLTQSVSVLLTPKRLSRIHDKEVKAMPVKRAKKTKKAKKRVAKKSAKKVKKPAKRHTAKKAKKPAKRTAKKVKKAKKAKKAVKRTAKKAKKGKKTARRR